MKKLALYPLSQTAKDNVPWVKELYVEYAYLNDEIVQTILTISQSMKFKEDTVENLVSYHINHPKISKNIKDA